eukprot:s1878_g2.t1
MDANRCSICWPPGGSPPYEWEKSSAPQIPKTKDDLIAKLTPHVKTNLKVLTVPELKHLYRKFIRGEKHPCDPTQTLSSLRKGQLQDLCRLHQLPDAGHKGELCLLLRQHWANQCLIAEREGDQGQGSETNSEECSVVFDACSSSTWSHVEEGPNPTVSEAIWKVARAVADLATSVSKQNDRVS